MGLAPVLVEQIFETIGDINRQGTTILLVEQNAAMALAIAHRGLRAGNRQRGAVGRRRRARREPEVRRAYLGE